MCYSVFMENFDGRKLTHKTREEIRIRAVKRVEAGESPEAVVKALGFHRSCIYEWIAKYRDGGVAALKTKAINGRPPKLDGNQLRKLFRMIHDKDPLQYKFPFALWTCAMIRKLIKNEFSVKLSDVSVGRLLKKLGFTPQKPLHKAYQKDEVLVNQWVTSEFPRIKELAKKKNATIFFGDESSVRSDYHSGTTWAPKGQTPVVENNGHRFSVNMVSAISPKGEMRFMAIDGRMNSDKFIVFLKRLMHGHDKPIFLIVDNHPIHKSHKIKSFVESTNGRLYLFYLPPYSPDLNPDEMVWRHLKCHHIGKKFISSQKELFRLVKNVLLSLQRTPRKIVGFYKKTYSGYAIL